LPLGPVATFTWISGFAAFQVATTFSMPGIHE
jgi:hypothetical protein